MASSMARGGGQRNDQRQPVMAAWLSLAGGKCNKAEISKS